MEQTEEKTKEELLKEMKELKPTIRNLRITKTSLALIEYGTLVLSASFGMTQGYVPPFFFLPILSSGIYGFLLASRYHYLKGRHDELNRQYVKHLEGASNKRK